MKLCQALADKMADVRLTDKLLAAGRLSSEQLNKMIHDLPDDSGKMTFTENSTSAEDHKE
ncbi:MAG: hypothetical protein J6Y94_02005 [Bacteriovoracaceae bacterium]|nr:hypothetical protein [Bacteriovoracaceae bacterium]